MLTTSGITDTVDNNKLIQLIILLIISDITETIHINK